MAENNRSQFKPKVLKRYRRWTLLFIGLVVLYYIYIQIFPYANRGFPWWEILWITVSVLGGLIGMLLLIVNRFSPTLTRWITPAEMLADPKNNTPSSGQSKSETESPDSPDSDSTIETTGQMESGSGSGSVDTPHPNESVRRYCPSCGEKINTSDEFCRHCGNTIPHLSDSDTTNEPSRQEGQTGTIADSENTDTIDRPDETDDGTTQWNPKYPIQSVFTAIMLLWAAAYYGRVTDLLTFGIPAILILPRIRLYVIQRFREQFDIDLTSQVVVLAVSVVYILLLFAAVMSAIASAASEPVTRSPTQGLVVALIMICMVYLIAIVIVNAIRSNRQS